MPRRAQTRTLAKWLGMVLTALLLIAWIGTTRYSANHTWNVRTDPTPAAARPKELAPFSDLTNFDWVFRFNSDTYLPSQFRHQVGFAGGRVYLYHDDDNGRGWWNAEDPRWSMRPGFDARIAPERRGFRPAFFALPLWFPVAFIGIPTALLWRTDLRARRVARLNLCTLCGYDLAATTVTAPCPECGKVRPAERAFRAHTRLRRNLARVGTVLAILLFVGWIGSAYVNRTYRWNIKPIPVPQQDAPVATTDGAPPNAESAAGNATLRFQVRLPGERWDEVGVGGGLAWVAFDTPLQTWLGDGAISLGPVYVSHGPYNGLGRGFSISLWIPFLLVAIPTALLWCSGRHERTSVSGP